MTDSRLATEALEALSTGIPDRQLATKALENLTTGIPERWIATVALEVLTPTVVVNTAFIGWGIPA